MKRTAITLLKQNIHRGLVDGKNPQMIKGQLFITPDPAQGITEASYCYIYQGANRFKVAAQTVGRKTPFKCKGVEVFEDDVIRFDFEVEGGEMATTFEKVKINEDGVWFCQDIQSDSVSVTLSDSILSEGAKIVGNSWTGYTLE